MPLELNRFKKIRASINLTLASFYGGSWSCQSMIVSDMQLSLQVLVVKEKQLCGLFEVFIC